MIKAIDAIDTISRWTGKIFAWLIWIGIASTLFEVVARYVFDAPTLWSIQLNQRLFAFYFIIGGAYGVLTKAHIRVDVVYNHFPPKVKAVVDLVLYPGLLFVVAFVFIWYGGELGLSSLGIQEKDYSPPHFPIYPVKLVIPVAGSLLMLQGIAELARNALNWRRYGR